MDSKASRKKSEFAAKKSITKYKNSIEHFLQKENKSYSQLQIAEELFDIPLRKEGNIPSSTEELFKLSYIKAALKILTKDRKVTGSLIEDPVTKEEVMCCSISGRYAN
jgi:hypothetical protein